jgi:hypothetical protein
MGGLAGYTDKAAPTAQEYIHDSLVMLKGGLEV